MIRVGTSGWSYAWWRGLFYPEDLPARDWLPFYARSFDTVEINMTFYRFPPASTLKAWREKTPAGFCFALKAPKRITHIKRLKDAGEDIRAFASAARNLGPKLGPILFQLPAGFKADFPLLEEFASGLPPDVTNVVEFRHPSWYSDRTAEILERRGIVLAAVSSEKMPPDITETSKTAYLRFHGLTGGYRYRYSDDELRVWADRLRALRAKAAFVYFNNDDRDNAVSNAARLKEILEE